MQGLKYEKDVEYYGDPEMERARRVEIYRKQMAEINELDPEGAAEFKRMYQQGHLGRAIFCPQFSTQYPNGFKSVREAAKVLSVDRSALKDAMKRKGRYLRYDLEFMPQPRALVPTKTWKSVWCVTDNIEFATLTEAAKHGEISKSTLSEALTRAKGAAVMCKSKVWMCGNAREESQKPVIPTVTQYPAQPSMN